MNPQATKLDLDILWKRVLELCIGYIGKPPYRSLMIRIMTDHDFSQKDIAEFIGLNHSTIYYYQNRYKPLPGEVELLEKLKEEF